MNQHNLKKISPLALIGILVALFLISSVCFAAQESITLTTYYPAPYGIYRELRADQMAIGEGYRDNALYPLSNGMLIVEDRVGIGTPTPTGVLDVDGGEVDDAADDGVAENITLRAQSAVENARIDNQKGGDIILYPGNSAIDDYPKWAGKVGIGLDDPEELLHVKTVATDETDYHDIAAIFESRGDAGGYIALKDNSTTDYSTMPRVGAVKNDLYFQLKTADVYDVDTKMIIKAETGRVGIGTTDPLGLLHLVTDTDPGSGATLRIDPYNDKIFPPPLGLDVNGEIYAAWVSIFKEWRDYHEVEPFNYGVLNIGQKPTNMWQIVHRLDGDNFQIHRVDGDDVFTPYLTIRPNADAQKGGNVGIFKSNPRGESDTATKAPNNTDGNLDVNDIWVRALDNDNGAWISEGSTKFAINISGNMCTGLTSGKRYLVGVYGTTRNAGQGRANLGSVVVRDGYTNAIIAKTEGALINWPDGNVPQSAIFIITAQFGGTILGFTDGDRAALNMTVLEI